MKLFRLLPWNPDAAADQPGGVFYAPRSTANRVSNADLYRELYLAGVPEAAIAEALGDLVVWRAETFVRPIGRLALAAYDLNDGAVIFDLDNLDALRELGIGKPSRVVTPNRRTTQAWARSVYERHSYVGVSWWSRYSADWNVYALWNVDALRIDASPTVVHIDSEVVVRAARAIAKQRLGAR